MKITSEKEKLKKPVKKPDGFLKLHVEDVSVIIMKCTILFLSVHNVTFGITNIVTFLKIREFVNPVFYPKIIKQKNQELTNANFVEQEDFYTFQ